MLLSCKQRATSLHQPSAQLICQQQQGGWSGVLRRRWIFAKVQKCRTDPSQAPPCCSPLQTASQPSRVTSTHLTTIQCWIHPQSAIKVHPLRPTIQLDPTEVRNFYFFAIQIAATILVTFNHLQLAICDSLHILYGQCAAYFIQLYAISLQCVIRNLYQ